MSGPTQPVLRLRLLAAGLGLLISGLPLSACTEVEQASTAGYEPAKLEPVGGTENKRVTFTEEGARRTGLQTAAVMRRGDHLIVPYAALIYDGQGESFVYTSPERLTFLRVDVDVDRVERNRVLLTEGPRVGSRVVTVGATEVYGAELDIAGGH
jgi:hypothetical protein